MSVTNSQRVHHHKTNSYQQSPTTACISNLTEVIQLNVTITSTRMKLTILQVNALMNYLFFK